MLSRTITWTSYPAFDFYLDDQMIIRATSWSFAKAISSLPLTSRKQRISLCCRGPCEIALMTSSSRAALRRFLDEEANLCPYLIYSKKLYNDAICLSYSCNSILCNIAGGLQVPDPISKPIERDYFLHLDVDKNTQTVTWRGGEGVSESEEEEDDVIGKSPLPSDPIWLVYCSLERGSGVRVMRGRECSGASPSIMFALGEESPSSTVSRQEEV